MATTRLTMRKTRDILRLKWVQGLSHREVARSLGISAGVVGQTMSRAKAVGLDWEATGELTDEELAVKLYGPRTTRRDRPVPDLAYIHRERRRPGVTLELLHLEYLERHPDGYRYTRFCDLYRAWCREHKTSMRQVHRAGEKLFVDYSGKKPSFQDPQTGERIECELFVAVLGASNYTFAEATLSQKSADWIGSHVRAFAFFGGVTKLVVPDQLKSGVSKACRYEPGIQKTYEEMAEHYATAVLPARQRKPKDKAKVEVAVQVAQRRILARIRNETFFSLDELNDRISELCDELNEREMKAYQASRRQLFEQLDRPVLTPLPKRPYVRGEWKKVKVNIDYHVEVDGHFYSVPFPLVGQHLEARFTTTIVEVFHKSQRVAVHARSYKRGRHSTVAEHLPKSHREHLKWSPSRLIAWAAKVGPQTAALVEAILESRPHPEQGYRSCLGIMRLAKRDGGDRLERACERALLVGARSYRHVDSILKNGLDRMPMPGSESDPQTSLPLHENVRGQDYYN